MDVKKLALLIGALIIAGVSALLVRNMVSGTPAPIVAAGSVAPAAVIDGPQVLVATKSLPVGTIIDATALKFQPWPKDMIEKAYYMKDGTDPASLNGKVVRYAITAGQPVTQGSLVGPGERGFLAAALGPGMRAVTVPVNNVSGVAGFVFPGDRVDLFVTHQVSLEEIRENTAGDRKKVEFKTTDMVASNIRVLAVDQRTTDPDNPTVGQTVTFEATPKIAEKIILAQRMGDLSLSLRSIADNGADLERAIASGAIEVKDGQTPADDRAMEIKLAALPSDKDVTSTTSGELSPYDPSRAQADAWVRAFRSQMPGSAGSAGVVRIARGNTVTNVPLGAQ